MNDVSRLLRALAKTTFDDWTLWV